MKSLKKNMKNKSRFIIALLTALILVFSQFTDAKIIRAATDYNEYWTKTVENGEDVYTAIPSKNNQEYGSETQFIVENCTDNAFEVSFRANSEAINKNVGMHVITSLHNYFYDYRQDVNALRFRIDNNWIAYSETINVALNEWFTLKMIFDDGIVKCYANGMLKYSITNDDIALEATNLFTVSAWETNSSFKNAKSFKETIEYGYDIPSSWITTKENDETVYTLTNSSYSAFYNFGRNNGTYNTFEFDFRINAVGSTYDCNIGATIVTGKNYFFFEYNPADARQYFRLRYFPDGSTEGEQIALDNIDISPLNRWNNMKVVFASGYLAGYLNGTLVVLSDDTRNENLNDAKVGISAWNTSPSVKNLTTSLTTINYASLGKVDLEFKSDESVKAFTPNNANLTYDNGQLILSITGNNPSITSPTIIANKGSLYSANLNVRNTFLVRLRNNSTSNRVKIYFKTRLDDNYYSKEFDIKPLSEYESYYFNISDVFDCGEWHTANKLKKCKHYLSEFAFEFLNVNDGSIAIDAITFEREDRLINYAANNVKAIANNNDITISGTLKDEYVGSIITLLQTEITNYNELINWPNNKELASFKSLNKEFSFKIPFKQKDQKDMTHLSTMFMLVSSNDFNYLTGIKLSKVFMVNNFNDFANNPNSFEIQDKAVVKVTDFGAKGDSFTNDNEAIQKAIDYVYAQGGGTVVFEGDTSNTYGRRYIMTNIELKDNVHLKIEAGAILWQSQRLSEYHYDGYEPVTSHDVDIPGAAWAHSGPTWNRPFIFVENSKNVKINGGGKIRMADPGTDCLDGNRYAWDSDITNNCGLFVHENPIAVSRSENVEIKDITIARNQIWTVLAFASKKVYFGNINVIETSCINGDGFNFFCSSNSVIERCTLYSNDDAIIMSTCYYDPRYDESICPHAWFTITIGKIDNSTHDITIRHNNVFGGHGLTFIPWGSEDPNESREEIYNIFAYDNVLGGTSTSVGVWGDNPYYGTSGIGSYDQLEANDYSPMRDIFIHDNIYTQDCVLATWKGGTLYNATNIITDCGINSASNFINGNFEKTKRFENETNYVTGLANWSRSVGLGGSVGTTEIDKDLGYSAYIKGNASLYEGLYKIFGTYKLTVKTYLESGSATLFVKDYNNGIILATKEISNSSSFIEESLEFSIKKSTTIHVGVIHQGKENEIIYLDDFNISKGNDKSIYDFNKTSIAFKKADDFSFYNKNNTGFKMVNGTLYTTNESETKAILSNYAKLKEFVFELDIACNKQNALNAGVYLFAKNPTTQDDLIDALNVQLESKVGTNTYAVKMFEFSSTDGYIGAIAKSEEMNMPENGFIHLKVVSKNGVLLVFVDNQDDYCIYYELPKETYGSIGLRSQYQNSSFSNITLKVGRNYGDVADISELTSLINKVNGLDESLYTESSYEKFKAILAEAKLLSEKDNQEDIDLMIVKLNEAFTNLILKEQTPPVTPSKGCKGTTIGGCISLITVGGVLLLKKKKAK